MEERESISIILLVFIVKDILAFLFHEQYYQRQNYIFETDIRMTLFHFLDGIWYDIFVL